MKQDEPTPFPTEVTPQHPRYRLWERKHAGTKSILIMDRAGWVLRVWRGANLVKERHISHEIAHTCLSQYDFRRSD